MDVMGYALVLTEHEQEADGASQIIIRAIRVIRGQKIRGSPNPGAENHELREGR